MKLDERKLQIAKELAIAFTRGVSSNPNTELASCNTSMDVSRYCLALAELLIQGSYVEK